jgi:hypothetical protein
MSHDLPRLRSLDILRRISHILSEGVDTIAPGALKLG